MNTAIQPVQTMPASPEELAIKATSAELVAAAKNVVIMTHVELSQATDLVKAIKQRHNEAEEARTRITKPINEGLREINARFKTITEPLTLAEADVKRKMVAFQDAEERRARAEAERKERERQEQERKEREAAEARRKEEEAQASDPTLDRPSPVEIVHEHLPFTPPVAPIQPEIRKTTYGQSGASTTFKKVWDYELVDLSKVPVQFLQLDATKVGQAVKAGIREIPGIRVFEKTVSSVR